MEVASWFKTDSTQDGHRKSNHVWWRKLLAEVAGGCQPEMTQKDQRTLKKMLNFCPDDQGDQVVEYAVRNWSKFRAKVREDYGYSLIGAVPELNQLAKFIHVAVNLYAGVNAASKEQLAKTGPVQLISPEDDDTENMSIPELLAAQKKKLGL